MSDEYWLKLVQETSELIESQEEFQRTIGRKAYDIVTRYGKAALKEFTNDINTTTGKPISLNTLRNKLWVYERTKDLDLPEDLTARCLQTIAGSPDPSLWAKRIKKEGLSSLDVYWMIKAEKGVKKIKDVKCPVCGNTFTPN